MSENPIAEFQKDLHKLAVTVARMEEKIDRVLTSHGYRKYPHWTDCDH